MAMHRQQMISGASAAAASLVGMPISSLAKAPLQNTQVPAFYRFKIGDIEATVVSDGPMPIGAPSKTFIGPTAQELGQMMTDHFLPADNVVLDQNALVVNIGGMLSLFETGMSSAKRSKDMGRLTQNLKAAGIDPKDIDFVIPTHTHIDHIGGILAKDGSQNFPNAQISSRRRTWTTGPMMPGWAHRERARRWRRRKTCCHCATASPSIATARSHSGGAGDAHAGSHRWAYLFLGRLRLQDLYVAGDLVHHQIIVEKPRMEDFFDTDRKLGIETRLRTMDMLAGQKLLSIVYHLPWPGLGHFSKRGDGFHFEPEPIQVVL